MHWIFRPPPFPGSRWSEMKGLSSSSWVILLLAWLCGTDMTEALISAKTQEHNLGMSHHFYDRGCQQSSQSEVVFSEQVLHIIFLKLSAFPFFSKSVWETVCSALRLELKYVCIKSVKASVSLIEKLRNFLFLERENGRGRGRKGGRKRKKKEEKERLRQRPRETSISCLLHASGLGTNPQPRCVSWQEWKLWYSSAWNHTPTNPATTARASYAILTGLFSSTTKMKTKRFMLLTKPESQKKRCFWIPVKERSLWKAEPVCTAITKGRALGHYSNEDGEQGPARLAPALGTRASSLQGLFISAKLFAGTSFQSDISLNVFHSLSRLKVFNLSAFTGNRPRNQLLASFYVPWNNSAEMISIVLLKHPYF